MGRIADRFQFLRSHGQKGFIPFVTAGDPDIQTSLEIVRCLARLGADVIELGVPFSDPMADGPTIQRSSQRALAKGTDLSAVLQITREVRRDFETPIVLFSYLNPLLRYGFAKLTDDASASGVDGVLITDVVDEEAFEFSTMLGSSGLDLISLIAPTTTDRRLELIAAASTGFLYAISRAGVTGATRDIGNSAEGLVARARRYSDLPVAVGFGISTAEQIADVWRYADAAVVGSAIVAEIERSSPKEAASNVERFVGRLVPSFANSGTEL